MGIKRVQFLLKSTAPLAFVLGLTAPCAASAANIAQISKLSDVTFTNLDPMVSASNSQNVCVYSSNLYGLYTVKATGSGPGSTFTLQGGAGIPDLPYSVLWSPNSGQITGTAVIAGLPIPNLTSAAQSLLCGLGIGTSASLTVSLASSDLQQAVSGITYTGQLSITITAQ